MNKKYFDTSGLTSLEVFNFTLSICKGSGSLSPYIISYLSSHRFCVVGEEVIIYCFKADLFLNILNNGQRITIS